MKKTLMLALLALCVSITACGGGGSDAPEAPSMQPVQIGGTPADTLFFESQAICEKHNGFYERTSRGEMNTATVVFYEVRCGDGTKVVAGFDSSGKRVQ